MIEPPDASLEVAVAPSVDPPQTIEVPLLDQHQISLVIDPGSVVYVVGPNGAGKSALMGHLISKVGVGKYRRITAHRQNWSSADAPGFAPSQRASQETNAQNYSTREDSRYMDHDPNSYVGLALARLIGDENDFHRKYRPRLLASGKTIEDFDASIEPSPLQLLNKILLRASLNVQLLIKDESLRALVGDGEIGVSRLSDGERNAVFLSADVLTAAKGTILFIDEPERHLHRAIMNPLLRAIFHSRPDCAFVIATHELSLPFETPDAQVVLLKGTVWNVSGTATAFKADLIDQASAFPEGVRESILGSRDKILFMEGDNTSLDLAIYSLLLEGISVKPTGGCSEVIAAVTRLRNAPDLHWVTPFGLIDKDDRSDETVASLKLKGIFAIDTSTVEGIYYCREAMTAVATLNKAVDAKAVIDSACSKALSLLAHPTTAAAMCRIRVLNDSRQLIMKSLPREIGVSSDLPIVIPLPLMFGNEMSRYNALVSHCNLAEMMRLYSLKKTSCFQALAEELGYKNRKNYEEAVLDCIHAFPALRESLRTRLGGLPEAIKGPPLICP